MKNEGFRQDSPNINFFSFITVTSFIGIKEYAHECTSYKDKRRQSSPVQQTETNVLILGGPFGGILCEIVVDFLFGTRVGEELGDGLLRPFEALVLCLLRV